MYGVEGVLIATGTASARASRIPVIGNSVIEPHDYSRDGANYLTVSDVDPSHPFDWAKREVGGREILLRPSRSIRPIPV